MEIVNIISCCVAVLSMMISIYIFVITHKAPPVFEFKELNGVKYLVIKNTNNWNLSKLKIYDTQNNKLILQKRIFFSTETICLDMHSEVNDCYKVEYFVYGIYFSQKVYLTDMP